MIKIYNTLTREKEVFTPIEAHKVRMYVCGPTVYNYIHIGNARSAIAFDTIRRYFEYRGYEVNYVSNFTDVDDKIIKAAKELKITAPEVAERFIKAFEEDTQALNVQPATLHPRVMDHMPDILAFIDVLIEKGFAYEVAGDVYYRTRKFPNYGKLSHQSIDELEVGASQRTGVEQQLKEDPLDFALWKSAKEDEISWDSPWGKGRPGWHIECSVMATKHLGETIDIHGGGQDLEFPHHENEIAQSEAKTGHTFANYWMHNGYVTIGEDDEKMSKSLGNFITLDQLFTGDNNVLEQAYSPMTVRFFILQAHYRSPLDFSNEALKAAEKGYERMMAAVSQLNRLKVSNENTVDIAALQENCFEAINDDLNTPILIAHLFEGVRIINSIAAGTEKINAENLDMLKKLFHNFVFDILGLKGEEDSSASNQALGKVIDAMMNIRKTARANKDWATSDSIRDELKNAGIQIKDTKDGYEWSLE